MGAELQLSVFSDLRDEEIFLSLPSYILCGNS